MNLRNICIINTLKNINIFQMIEKIIKFNINYK